jgi:hypothetical protein
MYSEPGTGIPGQDKKPAPSVSNAANLSRTIAAWLLAGQTPGGGFISRTFETIAVEDQSQRCSAWE